MDLSFFITSILLGVGLAMDAFSVSIVNAMTEPDMKHGRMAGIAGASKPTPMTSMTIEPKYSEPLAPDAASWA